MAEAAGLAIGTFALVGTFKDCIDVYGMIIAARSLTDDAEILNTKLDVERMLLLQWADRVGLTEPESYDRRLDDPDLNSTIARVLQGIKRLLSDGKELRDKYGLVEYQGLSHSIVLDDRWETRAGSTRLQNFITKFNRLSFHTGSSMEAPQSVSARFKWVVRDREKFASLMSELSYFVSRLNALVPEMEPSPRTMTEYDLAQIRDIPQLKVILKASIGSQPQISLIAQQRIRYLNQGRVLDRLWFRWIDDRKANIADRHPKTFDWALDPPESQTKWDNLAEWLKSGSGLYWLAGKPGSGKSTLMKYLSDHPRTFSLLKEWAGQSQLLISKFFFYSLGRPEQKSQEGILRSLLYQLLDEDPEVIEHVLPAMWKEATITENQDHELAMPSLSEIQTALFHLAGTVFANKKLCILIDALDEFHGKYATIANLILKLGKKPNVKIIVSSRPVSVFVSRFERAPKMYLQDLTNQDIATYVDDTVINHPCMSQVAHFGQGIPEKIACTLTEKASGVFLWVVLACRSIIEGLEDYETVPELMNRVKELPSELDEIFRRIISGVDPRKRDQCARLLRLVFESHNVFDFMRIPSTGLAIVDEQGLRADYMGPSVKELSDEQLMPLRRMFQGRLRTRCSGLIEIQGCVLDRHTGVGGTELMPVTAEDEVLYGSGVQFMHRSLYDFLCIEGMWEWEVLHVDNECGPFEPNIILASLWTQLAGVQELASSAFQVRCLENALIHNAQAEAAQCPPGLLATSLSRLQGLFAGYDEAYNANAFEHLTDLCLPHQLECRKNYDNLPCGLALAAEMGMVGLIQFALEDPDELRRRLILPNEQHVQDCSSLATCPKGVYKSNRDRFGSETYMPTLFPLLYHATCQPFLHTMRREFTLNTLREANTAPTKAVEYLLDAGHDPNEEFFTDEEDSSTTPWVQWLLKVEEDSLKPTQEVERVHRQASITLLLVDAGAEIGASGTESCDVVDEFLWGFISEAEQRGGRQSEEQARSDALWLKVRDRIQSLRAAASTQGANS